MANIVDKAKDALHMNKKSDEIKIAGLKVHHTGYGLMGLTWRANPPPQEQAFEAMKAALDNGAIFWNGGELYGNENRNSLHLLNEYFTKYPEDGKLHFLPAQGALDPF